ncbi:VIT1/CCC1 transporter family protein [Methylocapsa polymorpha]|uniref:VIT1/CCC1 transporter family protein n=1 Tax=Methylocapsa polymorpha TaxID=3080828 RepID=A0ABZ0HYF4_9HYPH|nr:VIT1/CCC1 transporter family protein [Methylocapsa sp. RX1]
MTIAPILLRLKRSLLASAGTIVFGMEDGTVSIFGLVFGVAATTSSSAAVVVAGASGAVAAAVSMMAGAYLDAETNRDEMKASQAHLQAALASDAAAIAALLSKRLAAARLTHKQSAALASAVRRNPEALKDLLLALQAGPEEAALNPLEQALWMLLADFLSAAVPMLPFFLLPVPQARIVSAVVTITLLAALGVGRAGIGGRNVSRTVAETVSIGVAAAAAGVAIGLFINRSFNG